MDRCYRRDFTYQLTQWLQIGELVSVIMQIEKYEPDSHKERYIVRDFSEDAEQLEGHRGKFSVWTKGLKLEKDSVSFALLGKI